MSLETRQWVCDRLAFTTGTQRNDLMDPTMTSTALISFLWELLTIRDGVWQKNIVVTSVRSDHPTQDGPNGHQGGNAIDFITADSAKRHLITDTQACEAAKGIGLGGLYRQYSDDCGGYSQGSKLFADNDQDHIHTQVVGY